MTTQYFVRFFFYPFITQGRIILGHTVLLFNSVHIVYFRYKKNKTYKISGRKHIYLPHAQTAIYDFEVKIFLKQGISRQLGRG
jgi:hypothetical protein